jgi:gas vesicle protein
VLTFAAWFAVGLAAGTAAGLILAPAPGRDTREAITARAGYAGESARLYLDKARDMARSFVETAQEQATRLSEAMAAGVEEARRIRDDLSDLDSQQETHGSSHPEEEA